MRDNKELQLLYQSTTEEIRFKKSRQWQTAAYYSAIAAFLIVQDKGVIISLGEICRISLVKFLFLLGSAYYVVLLVQDRKALENERKVLRKIHKLCGREFKKARKHKGKVTEFDHGDNLIYLGYILLVVVANFILWTL